MTHLLAEAALDGLLFVGSWLEAQASVSEGWLSSLKPDGVGHTELLIVQGVQVYLFFLQDFLSDLGDGLDHGDRHRSSWL